MNHLGNREGEHREARFNPRPFIHHLPEAMAYHSMDNSVRTTQPSALHSTIYLDMQRITQSTNVCRLYFCLAVSKGLKM